MEMNYWAVVPAAGVGRRMQAGLPKQYLLLNGRRVIDWTLEVLLAEPRIRGVYVALGAEDPFWESCEHAGHPRVRRVAGGEERAHSVLSALLALETEAAPADRVLVHDAARPCLRPEDLSKLLELASGEAGGLLAMPVRDTMKRADAEGRSETTLDRSRIWHAFTPQLFPLATLRDALEQALAAGVAVTDEASAMEWAGNRPRLVEGHPDNIKITRPGDLELAGFYLQKRNA
ncbi:MAG: 2-C-methyl-D-erythritol 4-phosphate cytidylyltransferase [Gammaproteobacteria bacterium]|nr:MAG: 2-C-methyl-D-erythritol 4-phosphate cytidylyltransferase [Gammaproteobacteria bacterium]RTZ72613.1 MAG: 2-C-methyl-D-erythritol 4-phosphate cytidylyltransferase [Gammaproteobacteria bacterium]